MSIEHLKTLLNYNIGSEKAKRTTYFGTVYESISQNL